MFAKRKFEEFNQYQQSLYLFGLLAIYCFGHGFLTSEPLFPFLTIIWSFSHSTGIITLKLASHQAKHKSLGWQIVVSVGLGIIISSSLYAMLAWLLGLNYILHNYTSIIVYCLIGALLLSKNSHIPKGVKRIWVDCGRHKVSVNPENIMIAKAARNYVEITQTDEPKVGVVRSSILKFQSEHPHLLRIHRSTLINPSFISKIIKQQRGCFLLTLNNGSQVKVSSKYAAYFSNEI